MQGAAFDQQQAAVEAHNLSSGEAVGDDAECELIGVLAVERHKDAIVDDEEVGVARREVAAGQTDRLRHRELDDVEALLARAHLAQAFEVFLERGVVRRGLVGFSHRENRARGDEAREVVDVAIRVIVGEAFPDPQEFIDGEAVADGGMERSIVAAFGPVRVVLHGFGREQQAVARDFDAAAFEFKRVAEFLEAEPRGNLAGDLVVERSLELPAPAVEFPVGEGEFLGRIVLHEDRTVVAAPHVVRGDVR